MTQALSKERLEEIINVDARSNPEVREMARFMLGALEQEPVADVVAWSHPTEERTCEVRLRRFDLKPGELYYHPVPVVECKQEPVFFVEIEGDDWINAGRIEGKNRPDLGLLPDGINYLYTHPAPSIPETVTAEQQRVIQMLLNVCGAAFELADDSCQQEVDGESCHVAPDASFLKLSDALDEIENTLPDEYADLPNTLLQWAAVPRHALRTLLQPNHAPSIPAPELTVWYGSMPESNGKTNWTAMLHRKGQIPWEGITVDRSEYPQRVLYEADRMRHLIGEIDEEPDILAYDENVHSGYVAPVRAPSIPAAVPDEATPDMQAAGAAAIRFDTTPINKLFTANAVWRAMRAAMLQSEPVVPDWQRQAEKNAENYGCGFAIFRRGEAPECADPTKVVISFTDKGLGVESSDLKKKVLQDLNQGARLTDHRFSI